MPHLLRVHRTHLFGLPLLLLPPLLVFSQLAAQQPGEPVILEPGQALRATIDEASPILPVAQRPFALFRLDGLITGQRYLVTATGDGFAPTLSLLYGVAGLTETRREGQVLWEDARGELSFVAEDLPGAIPLLMVSSWDLPAGDAWPVSPARFFIALEERAPTPTPPVRDLELGDLVTERLDLAEGGFLTEWEEEVPAHLWRISVPVGTLLRIEMGSEDLDSYLEFGFWDGTLFEVLASDDDGGIERNAVLRTVVRSPGPHWIRARSFGAFNGSGSYTLRVIEDEYRSPTRQSLEVGIPSSSILTEDDAILDESGILFQEWTFFGEAGVPLTIRMNSDNLDSYLSLGTELDDGTFEELAFNDDDPDGGLNSRLDFTPDTSRVYLIRARTFGPGGLGPYIIEVTPAGPGEGSSTRQ